MHAYRKHANNFCSFAYLKLHFTGDVTIGKLRCIQQGQHGFDTAAGTQTDSVGGAPGPVWARERCRISPPCFLAECCKRQLNQGSLVLLYYSLFTFSDLYWVFYLYFPVLFSLSVLVKWLAAKTTSEMTYIVSSGALNSTPTNQSNQGSAGPVTSFYWRQEDYLNQSWGCLHRIQMLGSVCKVLFAIVTAIVASCDFTVVTAVQLWFDCSQK